MDQLVIILTGLLMSIFTERIQSATVTWVVGTSPVKYGKIMQLTCTISGVASCCSGANREWRRGSTNTLLLLNGLPTPAAGTRFKEDLLPGQNQMNLKISDFDISDYNMDYSCVYGFDVDTHNLTIDGLAEYNPVSTDLTINEIGTHAKDIVNYKLSVPLVFISKIAPDPKVTAIFGETTLNVSLTKKYDGTAFYNLTLALDADFNCPKGDFKLTVTAGTHQFDVYNQDICRCWRCTGLNCLCSFSTSVLMVMLIFGYILFKGHRNSEFKRKVKIDIAISFAVFFMVNMLCSFIFGLYSACACLGYGYLLFLLCGYGTAFLGIHAAYIKDIHAFCFKAGKCQWCVLVGLYLLLIPSLGLCFLYLLYKQHGYFVAEKVRKKKGSTIIFICPFRGKTQWHRVYADRVSEISVDNYIADSSIQDRVFIVGEPDRGVHNLKLSGLQKSDEGMYRCIVGNQEKFYKLETLECQTTDNVALSEGTSSSKRGLFSWASCKVGQEPVNSSQNSAPPKGKATKTPTNERDKKQLAVVKPEVNTKHIKTENREKETSFTDGKDFESNLNKVPKGRRLPQLTETSTPRALPPKPDALPPIAGRRLPELDDLDETSPEKKKKKKKKKMQDDDEL